MAIMPNDFWSGWIIVITVTSLLGLAWLVLSIYLLRSGDDQLHEEPVWDENLQEGNTPAPLWWFWLILAMMVFSVVYLMLYPGLGSFQGAFQWSQGGQLAERQASYNAEFEPLEQQIVSSSYEALGNNELAMNTAAGIFEEHCSACHGIDARGQAGLFPSLSAATSSSPVFTHLPVWPSSRQPWPSPRKLLEGGCVGATRVRVGVC